MLNVLHPACGYQEEKWLFLRNFLGVHLTASHCGGTVNFAIFGMSRGVLLVPGWFTSFPAHIPLALAEVKVDKCCLPVFFFLLWHQLNCLLISSLSLLLFLFLFLLLWLLFGWWDRLLTLRLLETLPLAILSQSCLPHLPHFKPWPTVHLELGHQCPLLVTTPWLQFSAYSFMVV